MSHVTQPARPLAGAERPQPAGKPALIILVYAAAVYLLFLAVLVYAVGFFAGLGVPKESLGETYARYRARVPALIPRPRAWPRQLRALSTSSAARWPDWTAPSM